MKMVKLSCFQLLFVLFFTCCHEQKKLPVLGEITVDSITGKEEHYKAPNFRLTNQLAEISSHEDFRDKIQVVDFFFTSCPTICPTMSGHLRQVQEAFADNDKVNLLSFTIDPKRDRPQQLKEYAERYGADHNTWKFLTGNRDTIFELSRDYKVMAREDSEHGENFLVHDGTFVLVDGERRIRGYYNGLDRMDTQKLIGDIKILLQE
ncbi:MAG: SCO family protein [Bacteroidota bacterium]